jgi:hypothetical protein
MDLHFPALNLNAEEDEYENQKWGSRHRIGIDYPVYFLIVLTLIRRTQNRVGKMG